MELQDMPTGSGNEEQRIAICRAGITRIYQMLQDAPAEWESHLNFARSIATSLERVDFFSRTGRATEQTWTVAGIQKLAYHDADSGGVQDLADWCEKIWLRLLERDSRWVDALQGLEIEIWEFGSDSNLSAGLGHSWLLRAQKHLAFIHQEDGSVSSSSGSNGRASDGRSINGLTSFMSLAYTQRDEDVDDARAGAEAEARLATSHYVEARAMLVAATDLLAAATEAADGEGNTTGDLLCLTAEAYMSLGNVTSARMAEEHFISALRYLRRARQVPDYALAPYLQRYLDDYGRLVE
ncbi:MAG: hypothetical protein M1823_003000 [Watsoniomyces obsoletus]|nr:MAG: hypothetical protein M1823_003000 [Watsoniomyces obsoletus]